MSDEADIAADITEHFTRTAIQNALNSTQYQPKGWCLNCEEPLKEQAFCDADCREDYEKRTSARHRKV